MKALPVGSVVTKQGIRLLIVGYRIFEEEDKVYAGYHVVKYPRGYAGIESVGVLRFDEVDEVIFEGFRSHAETEFTKGLWKFHENSVKLDVEKWNLYMDKLNEVFGDH